MSEYIAVVLGCVSLVAFLVLASLFALVAMAPFDRCSKGGGHLWRATDLFRERVCVKCNKRQYPMREWEDC